MTFCNSTIFGCFLGIVAVLFSNNFTDFWKFQSLTNHFKNASDDNIISSEGLASSVWCSKRYDGSKLCKFKNLYYVPDFKEHLLFLLNEFSVVSGVEDLKHLSLSTVQNHSAVNLKLVIVKSFEYFLGHKVLFIDTNTFIIKRFKPDNIMHVIHDDVLPLFVTYKELCSGEISQCLSSYRLLLFDNNDRGPYFEWYMHFSEHEPIVIAKEKYPLCFKTGYFGLSNSSIWFQYGFKSTQGPVLNNYINSFILQDFAEFIRKQYGILRDETSPENVNTVVFLSRKVNRKILNEGIMEEKMKNIAQSIHKTNITIVNLDLLTNNSISLIYSLQRSQLLVGMHGSAMILAIFMQPGSQIIELFPFGIQPEFVSPLRALCKLKNIYYHYESWVNMKEFNTRTHPEYPPLLGGLVHLEDAKQGVIVDIKKVPAVECCHDPVYLFRMFQDTVVDDSFFILFHGVVSNHTSFKSKQKMIELKQELVMNKWYFPPPIFNLSCKCFDGVLKLQWSYPFVSEGIKFSIAISNGVLGFTKTTYFSLKIGECDIKVSDFPEPSVAVWVKAVDDDKDSLDSFARCTNH